MEYQKDVTLTYQGRPNTGSLNKTLSNAGDGWNLLGNPYPSAVDWDADPGWTKTNIGNAIYMWDATNENYTTYLGRSEDVGVAVNVDNSADASIIPKMQAFFVKASGSSPSIASTNEVRVHSSKEIIGNARVGSDFEYVKIGVEGDDGFSDELLIRSNGLATNGFDPKYDAFKLLSTSGNVPQVYSFNEFQEPMAINSIRDELNNLVIPLGFESQQVGEFTFNLKDKNLVGTELVLVDKKEGKTTNLLTETYTFFYSGFAADRFELHFSSTVTGLPFSKNGIALYTLEDGFLVKSSEPATLQLRVLDLKGSFLTSIYQELSSNESLTLRPDLPAGIYLIDGLIGEETVRSKIFIK